MSTLVVSKPAPEVASKRVLYTAETHTTGGRDGGKSRASDGRLEIQLSTPGGPGTGTNPEQLFAAGWSACFIGAMKHVAGTMKLRLPPESAVDTEIDLCQSETDGFSLQARLKVTLPGLEEATAQAIVDGAHQVCPYSKATRGNIGVEITLV